MTIKLSQDPEFVAKVFGNRLMRPPPKRYFTIRDKSTGKHKIVDRHLHRGMVIAVADFKEVALTIVEALNAPHELLSTVKGPQSERIYSSESRPAVLGDITQDPAHFGSVKWVSGIGDWVSGFGRVFTPPRS